MKFLDKIKNALFEEEYVEVEEKPKTVAPKKKKVKVKEKRNLVLEKKSAIVPVKQNRGLEKLLADMLTH